MRDIFTLPDALQKLIDEGIWPQSDEELRRQNLDPLITEVAIQSFAPDERKLYLYAEPFPTIETERINNKDFDDEWNALEEIDPKKALLIADFGLGSDTAIILDYRTEEPELLRLKRGKERNHWIPLGLSTEEFANKLRNNRAEQIGSHNSGGCAPSA